MATTPKLTVPHYLGLTLKNFRGFKKADDIRLAPLTFLVGPNSAGKSSIFNAILFITQNKVINTERYQDVPSWGGPLTDLGSYTDTVFQHNSHLNVEIGLEFSHSDYDYYRYRPGRPRRLEPIRITYGLKSKGQDPFGQFSSVQIADLETNLSITLSYNENSPRIQFDDGEKLALSNNLSFHAFITSQMRKRIASSSSKKRLAYGRIRRFLFYSEYLERFRSQSERVSSGRAAPRRWYSTNEVQAHPGRRYQVPRVFEGVDPAMIEASTRPDRFYDRSRLLLRKRFSEGQQAVEAILKELEIASEILYSKLSPYHSSIHVTDSITGTNSNLIDVGYGASQVIPILYACLGYSLGPLFVEQPEIHLHPKAQGVVADLLCRTSLRRQVVVETHSVRMINRARIMVAKGELPPEHVVINYVSRNKNGSFVQTIPLLKNGDFDADWPDGFFDERFEDTMTLLQLKSQE